MKRYIPETAIIEVTRACNFNCIHCGASAGKKLDDELSIGEIEKIIYDLKDLGCKAISLMGGEIFLRNDWEKIVSFVVESGLSCGIITNGYLLNSKKIEFIKDSGVIQLGISLDGSNPDIQFKIRGVKKSFEKAMSAIALALKAKIEYVTVITAVSKLNIDQLESIFSILKGFDDFIDWQIKLSSSHSEERFPKNLVISADDYVSIAKFIKNKRKQVKSNSLKINISGAHDLGYFSESFSDFPEKWQGCLAGLKTIGIMADGGVKGCLALPDKFIVGNIRAESLKQIWNDHSNFSITRNFKPQLLDGICKSCDKKNICKGGCHDFCYSLTNSVYNVPYCLYQLEK